MRSDRRPHASTVEKVVRANSDSCAHLGIHQRRPQRAQADPTHDDPCVVSNLARVLGDARVGDGLCDKREDQGKGDGFAEAHQAQDGDLLCVREGV